MLSWRGGGALIAAMLLVETDCAPAADFYAGKTITILVGSEAGGGFDAFARILARHFGSVIPGQPNVVVDNMPGAGSTVAASYLYSKAPKDGSVIGAFVPSGLLSPLFEHRAAAFDTSRFHFLGSASASARLCISQKGSRTATWEAAMQQKVIVGASTVASASYDYAYLHRNIHGGVFSIVTGYRGTADILLAMDRGEVEATCGLDRSSLRAQRPQEMRAGGYNFLLRVSVKPDAELDAMGVPEAASFARNPRDRAISDLIASQQIFGRPYLVAPDVPPERQDILRRAFHAIMHDPEFIAEADAAGLAIDSVDGERVEQAIRTMFASPPDIMEGARRAIRP